MTSATGTTKTTDGDTSKYEFYPEYCNAVSPTINKWCPLTAHDIHGLSWKVRIDNQKYVFFHLNHPIHWVRIVGVVVAIDSFYGRRIYTIDDSSGACIECCVTLPPPDKSSTTTTNNSTNPLLPPPPPDPYPGIETGLVVDVKGALTVFRNEPQLAVSKMAHLRSTGAEVAFWGKIRAFREGTLARPWFVDAGTARRLKRENEKDVVRRDRREERERRERQRQRQRLVGRGGGSRDKNGSTAATAYDEERRKGSRRDEGATARDHTRDSRRQKREEGDQRSSRRKVDGDADQEDAGSDQSERVSERHREDGKKGWEGRPSLRHKPQRPSKLSEVATYTEGKYDALGL